MRCESLETYFLSWDPLHAHIISSLRSSRILHLSHGSSSGGPSIPWLTSEGPQSAAAGALVLAVGGAGGTSESPPAEDRAGKEGGTGGAVKSDDNGDDDDVMARKMNPEFIQQSIQLWQQKSLW